MRILLTNDDGIDCEGLQCLARKLSKHDLWIVAPDRNRSAVSHCITMTTPLKIEKREDKVFTCSGVPVDCVINGVNGILTEKPDIILSGINRGANIGTDVLYSGTCAAARQAALFGIPGIAVSLTADNEIWDYECLASFISKNIDKLASLCSQDVFINVNAKSAKKYKGCCFTKLSRRFYGDSVKLYDAPDGNSYSFFVGGNIETDSDSESDFFVVENGMISISRVHAQPLIAEDKIEEFQFTL